MTIFKFNYTTPYFIGQAEPRRKQASGMLLAELLMALAVFLLVGSVMLRWAATAVMQRRTLINRLFAQQQLYKYATAYLFDPSQHFKQADASFIMEFFPYNHHTHSGKLSKYTYPASLRGLIITKQIMKDKISLSTLLPPRAWT